jgi:L-serine dehydratase
MAAANAAVSANMILSGFQSHIPLEETIQTMLRVGQDMPANLKCTYGGIACTETAQMITKKFQMGK